MLLLLLFVCNYYLYYLFIFDVECKIFPVPSTSLIWYAIVFINQHALRSVWFDKSSLQFSTSLFCHLQLVHIRALLLDSLEFTELLYMDLDYQQLIYKKILGMSAVTSEWKDFIHLHEGKLKNFFSFLEYCCRFILVTPELVYQYAKFFPTVWDDTSTKDIWFWFNQWPHRHTALINWSHKSYFGHFVSFPTGSMPFYSSCESVL